MKAVALRGPFEVSVQEVLDVPSGGSTSAGPRLAV